MTQPDNDPKTKLLQTLAASGDKWIQLIIIVLVTISGGGNFIKTSSVDALTQINHVEIHRALERIEHIDSVVDDSIARQKEINAAVQEILKELQEQQQKK